jgi:15-cis-phytoene desaturase
MIFAMPDAPGTFSRFDFVPWIPFPFGALVGILRNNDMINLVEKLQFGLALVPCILQGQAYVESMDKLSIAEWLKERGCPPAIEREIFIAMSKALAFVDPDKVSATVVLTALNRFLQEGDGSKIAFLDGAPPERLCAPLVAYIQARGGRVLLNKPLERIALAPDGAVRGFEVRGVRDAAGALQERELVTADRYLPPSLPRTNRTSLVPLLVLSGHTSGVYGAASASSLILTGTFRASRCTSCRS